MTFDTSSQEQEAIKKQIGFAEHRTLETGVAKGDSTGVGAACSKPTQNDLKGKKLRVGQRFVALIISHLDVSSRRAVAVVIPA